MAELRAEEEQLVLSLGAVAADLSAARTDAAQGLATAVEGQLAALNMAGRSLAHDLRQSGVAIILLHPGFVRTGMTGGQGLVDPPESAAGLIARIDELSIETSGGFWHANGEELPW